MNHVHAPIAGKLPFEIAGEGAIEFKKKKMRIPAHPSRDFARVHPFAGTVLGDHAWTAEIHLAGDPLDQRFGARNNGSDLKRSLQKALEEQHTHKMRIVNRRSRLVQSRSELAAHATGADAARSGRTKD